MGGEWEEKEEKGMRLGGEGYKIRRRMGGEGREGMRLGGEVEERRSVGEDIPLHMYLLTFFLLSRKNLISFPLRQFSTNSFRYQYP